MRPVERITYQATLEDKVGKKVRGVQQKLDELALTDEFVILLRNEGEARGLRLLDVWTCVGDLYHEVSKHARGNDGCIALHEEHYTSDGFAVLVAYFKVQDKWTQPLQWYIEPKERLDATEKD